MHKHERPGPAHAYPRYSLRSLAELLRIGLLIQNMAKRSKPAAGEVLVITNPNDTVVDNAVTAQVVAIDGLRLTATRRDDAGRRGP